MEKWLPPHGFTGVIEVTVDLPEVSCGTDLRLEQLGVPAGIPAEMRMLGWQESRQLLALRVEADVPG